MQRAVIAAVVTAVALFLSIPAAVVAAESGPPTKISADLAALPGGSGAAPQAIGPTAVRSFATSQAFMPVRGDWVTIDAVASVDPAALAADLSALGARNVAVAGRIVSARFPIQAIPSLDGVASLQFARPAYRQTNVGQVTSQGDHAMRSDTARTRFGLDGSGVTVGALSDSFNCLGGAGNDAITGDLPANVTVVQDNFSDCSDEGRAMLQIVYDVAPGANLAFATADGGQANFANNILKLRDLGGSDVIVDDVIYFLEPMFQDGPIAQAVDNVVASGVSYFSAAGNNARNAYAQAFLPGTFLPPGFFPGNFLGGTPHKFGASTMQSVSVPTGSQFLVVLQWDSPFFSVSGPPGTENDLDIYILANFGFGLEVVAAGTTNNLLSKDAVETVGAGCSGPPGLRCSAVIMIVNRAGTNPGRFKYVVYSAGGNPSVSPALNSGTIYGHANAAGAVAVGAAFYKTPMTLEPFSSTGTTPVLFDIAGNRLSTPDLRMIKPELVAPDGVDTTFFGFSDPDFTFFPNFFGTSAAAPHAAGVAALMLQGLPTLTPGELRTTLQQTAINMGPAGFDNNSGFGLINAEAALIDLHELTITAGPTGSPNPTSPGGAVSLSVTATDNFGHTLTYAWTAVCTGLTSNGVFADATAPATTWTAPANATGASKPCVLKVAVSDGHGFTKIGSLTETVRSVPKITTLTPATGPVGTLVTITGLSLGQVTDVTFSLNSTVPATMVTAMSVRAIVPEGAVTGVVRLTSPDGIGTSAGIFKVTPRIMSFTPASGIAGESVTINGFNLQVGSATPTVKFGTGPATVTSATPTSIVATILATSLSGKISVMTTDGTGMSATDFVVIKPPTIGAFTPASTPVGNAVTITGTNLNSVTEVSFNGTTTTAITVVSPTSIKVNVPPGATTGKITVVNRAGTAQSAALFKVSPRIDDIAPLTVVAGTDTVVTITGVNLRAATGNPTVKVGAFTIPVASVLSATDTQIQIKVPLGAVTGKVSVMTLDGTGTSAATLTVLQPPKVTAVTPLVTTVGSTLMITGANLTGATTVTFTGGPTATPTMVTATSLRVVVPAAAQTGPITITNPIGSGPGPTIKLTPKITGFAPPSALPLESVTISGFNLKVGGVDPTVKIGTVLAVVTAGSTDTSVTATVPLTAVTGRVSVMTTDGTGISAADFIVIRPPTITTFTPLSGPVGTAVTITGTNLNSVTDVQFNVTSAPGFTILSATAIRANVPVGATSGKISVTNRAGTAQSVALFKVTPKIDGFTPTTGPAGTLVTITGSNLKIGGTDPTVKIGAVVVPVETGATDTSVTVTVLPTAVTGRISVMTADGSGLSAANFVVIKPPTITAFTPGSGPVGAAVTITGTNLASVTDVQVNGTSASFLLTAVNTIRATVPVGATTGKIKVINPAGFVESVLVFKVTPKIDSFMPASALVGATVTISGSNLRAATGEPTVKIGAVPAAVAPGSTDTSVTVTVPNTAITGKISVMTADGTGISTDNFVVIKPPTITSFTPTSGQVGALVTITGTNLGTVSDVTFGGISAPGFTILSPTSIRANVPSGAATGKIAVTNPAGTGQSAANFTVLP